MHNIASSSLLNKLLAMFMAHSMPPEPPSPEDTLIPILAHNRMLPITVKALK